MPTMWRPLPVRVPYQPQPYRKPPALLPDDTCPAGPKYPNRAVNDSGAGTIAWTNPDNARVTDDTYATAVTVAQTTQRLNADDFRFLIASGQQIDGILVEVEAKVLALSGTLTCRIIKGGAISSTTIDQTVTTTEQFISFGGASNLWGETWTAADINAVTFGVSVRDETAETLTISVDSVRMTVYCSTPVAANIPFRMLMGVGT